jgi:hypothetical protein
MKKTCEDIMNLKDMISTESIAKIDEIGTKSQKWKKAYEIVWNNLPADKRVKVIGKKIKDSYREVMNQKADHKGKNSKKEQ